MGAEEQTEFPPLPLGYEYNSEGKIVPPIYNPIVNNMNMFARKVVEPSAVEMQEPEVIDDDLQIKVLPYDPLRHSHLPVYHPKVDENENIDNIEENYFPVANQETIIANPQIISNNSVYAQSQPQLA